MNNALRIQMLMDFLLTAMSEDCSGAAMSTEMEKAERWVSSRKGLSAYPPESGEAQEFLSDLEEVEEWWIRKCGAEEISTVAIPEGRYFIHASLPPKADPASFEELGSMLSEAAIEGCEYILITPSGMEFEVQDKAQALEMADQLEMIARDLRELEVPFSPIEGWN